MQLDEGLDDGNAQAGAVKIAGVDVLGLAEGVRSSGMSSSAIPMPVSATVRLIPPSTLSMALTVMAPPSRVYSTELVIKLTGILWTAFRSALSKGRSSDRSTRFAISLTCGRPRASLPRLAFIIAD